LFEKKRRKQKEKTICLKTQRKPIILLEFQSNAPFCHSNTNPIIRTTKKSKKAKNPLMPVLIPPKTQGNKKATSISKT
jgi:hypothetical protein